MIRNVFVAVIAILFLLLGNQAYSQLNVTTETNANALARRILGPGVQIMNAQFTGSNVSAGTFTSVPGSFPIDSGIVLTTGRAKSTANSPGVDGPAGSFASHAANTAGDAQLSAFANNITTRDACILQFDFIPQGDSISVRFIFGSEEYPEFNCTNFNDVFAFFLSGPGILGVRNIALVPHPSYVVPVAINTVNNGIPGSGGTLANCSQPIGSGAPFPQFYIDNLTGNHVTYDGHTVVFTAVARVIPCQTYRIKLAIADGTDAIFDSGVFIEAGSFQSNAFNVEASGPITDNTPNNRPVMIEGCKNAEIKVKRAPGFRGPFNVAVSYAGNATVGVDYTPLPSLISFTENENEKTFEVSAHLDALNEGTETALIIFSRQNCSLIRDTITLLIRDSLINRSKTDTAVCASTPVTLNAADAVPDVVNSWLWNTGQTNPSITIVQPGTYISTHIYSERCLNIDTFNVAALGPNLSLSATQNSLCEGDSAVLTATTTSPFTWNTGEQTTSITVTQPGQYWVTATDADNCSSVDTITIAQKPQPVINLGGDVSICENGAVTLDATNTGASYSWSNGATSPTITVSDSGYYSVEVDLAGCISYDTVHVAIIETPVINLGIDTTICENTSLSLDASFNGATHLWSTGATTGSIDVSTPGTYWVVNDLNGCISTDTITVAVQTIPVINLGPDSSFCDGGNVVLDASFSGASYQWSNGATTASIDVSSTGVYSVVASANGCSATDTVTITVTPIPTVMLGVDTTICNSANLVLDASFTGATHNWSTGATTPTIVVNSSGVYHVMNEIDGCIATDTIEIIVQPSPVLDLGADVSICAGETATLDATYPGATFLWSTGATDASITVDVTGTYSVVSTLNGCSATDTVQVNVTPIPAVNLGIDTTICENTTLQLNAAFAGASHLWSTGATTPTITVSVAGEYFVENDINGCTATDTIIVYAQPAPVVNLGADVSICAGESVTLNAAFPGATQIWSTGATDATINVTAAGTYSVVSTLNGCEATDAVVVAVTPLPTPNLMGDTTICESITVTLNAAYPGATHQWSTGATTPSIVVGSAGTYTVTNTLNGCTATAAVTVITTPAPSVNLGPDISICTYETAELDASYPGATYVWSNGATTPNITVNAAGVYSVVSTLNGCSVSDSVEVSFKRMPVANAGLDLIVPEKSSGQLNAIQHPNNASYAWSPPNLLNDPNVPNPIVTPLAATPFTLTVTSVDGCVATDEMLVKVQFPLVIPNAFSPNGDYINDTWRIGNIEYYPRSRVEIFNRYGQLVHTTRGGDNRPWDGTSKGRRLEPATYYYIIDTGEGNKFTGYVVLLR